MKIPLLLPRTQQNPLIFSKKLFYVPINFNENATSFKVRRQKQIHYHKQFVIVVFSSLHVVSWIIV